MSDASKIAYDNDVNEDRWFDRHNYVDVSVAIIVTVIAALWVLAIFS